MPCYVTLIPIGRDGSILDCWLGPAAAVAIRLGCGCGWEGPDLNWTADEIARCVGDTTDEVLADLERMLFTLHADQILDVEAIDAIGAAVDEAEPAVGFETMHDDVQVPIQTSRPESHYRRSQHRVSLAGSGRPVSR